MRRHLLAAGIPLLALAAAACSNTGSGTADAAAGDAATPQAMASQMPSPMASPMAGVDHSAMPMGSPSAMPVTNGATPTPTPSPTHSSALTAAPAAIASAAAEVAAAAPPAAFAQCAICHSVQPGKNKIGPSLAGVYGRKSGSVPGYHYSAGMQSLDVTWDEATLDRWLSGPSAMVPGTLMAMPGIKDAATRQAIIAYLKTLKG